MIYVIRHFVYRLNCFKIVTHLSYARKSGFGGLEEARWHLVPKFAGSNQTEAVEFFRKKKSSAQLPSEGK